MLIIQIIFWFFVLAVFYTYFGYPLIIYAVIAAGKIFRRRTVNLKNDYEPEVTLFIAAYNERDNIDGKVINSLKLDYPADKINFLWVTDGSDDGSVEMLGKYPEMKVLHEADRKGKINAISRGMKYVTSPIVIFCDANTYLSGASIKAITKAFSDEGTGCVAGEKRISGKEADTAAGSGEGMYWRYESLLKKLDSQFYTTVGAVGELFAVRRELFHEVEPDTILDDFVLSMKIAIEGYKIKYVPEAFAVETSSADVKEELKRKIRIAAGAFQSVLRLGKALNPIYNFRLAFQFISRKLLRWTIVPFSLPFLFAFNIIISLYTGFLPLNIYSILLISQVLFYLLVVTGWLLQNRNLKFKFIFVPYYVFVMNLAMWLGFLRFLKGSQSVKWERARRAV